MGIELLATLLGALTSLIAGGLLSTALTQKFIRRALNLPEKKAASYAERLSTLTQKLDAASGEVDDVLREIALVAENRQTTVEQLEKDLHHLETKEQEMKGRITALENTPVEVAEHFAELISAGEKRSTKRDYFLFGAGVLVTTAIGLAIQFLAV